MTDKFANHAVVTFTTHALGTRIYDPSFGNPFNSRLAWEDATVVNFGNRFKNALNERHTEERADVKGVLQTIWSSVEYP